MISLSEIDSVLKDVLEDADSRAYPEADRFRAMRMGALAISVARPDLFSQRTVAPYFDTHDKRTFKLPDSFDRLFRVIGIKDGDSLCTLQMTTDAQVRKDSGPNWLTREEFPTHAIWEESAPRYVSVNGTVSPQAELLVTASKVSINLTSTNEINLPDTFKPMIQNYALAVLYGKESTAGGNVNQYMQIYSLLMREQSEVDGGSNPLLSYLKGQLE